MPGGKDVLVTVYRTPPGPANAVIDVVSLADRSRKTVVRGGTAARYLPSGHLIYTNRNTMFAVPFDLDAHETRGTAVPVMSDVAFDQAAGIAQYRRLYGRHAGLSQGRRGRTRHGHSGVARRDWQA